MTKRYTLKIRGVSPNDPEQDVVGELTMTPQGAREVLEDIQIWLRELKDDGVKDER
jgi:hypothetical protein